MVAAASPALEEKLRPFRQFNLDHAAKEGVLSSSRGADPAVDQAQDAVKAREKALDDWLKEAQREHGCSLKWKHSAKDRYCVEAADVLFGRGGKLERLPAGWQQRSKTKKARSFAVPALKSLDPSVRRRGKFRERSEGGPDAPCVFRVENVEAMASSRDRAAATPSSIGIVESTRLGDAIVPPQASSSSSTSRGTGGVVP